MVMEAESHSEWRWVTSGWGLEDTLEENFNLVIVLPFSSIAWLINFILLLHFNVVSLPQAREVEESEICIFFYSKL